MIGRPAVLSRLMVDLQQRGHVSFIFRCRGALQHMLR